MAVLSERRLVEDQHPRAADEHTGQRQSALLAARRRYGLRGPNRSSGNPSSVHSSPDSAPLLVRQAEHDLLRYGLRRGTGAQAPGRRSPRGARARPPAAALGPRRRARCGPWSGRRRPDEQPPERRLAAAVRSDERDPLARPRSQARCRARRALRADTRSGRRPPRQDRGRVASASTARGIRRRPAASRRAGQPDPGARIVTADRAAHSAGRADIDGPAVRSEREDDVRQRPGAVDAGAR